ncbi:hypothetical protein PF010_g3024 [Phytophthora fragariae]|uniref:Uncharacterized protein n=1 Tax=Phytophthora fragariae TaxID=53985 RepID=A0A6G0LWZ3_9STRA|nr:hypothetical protein PF010_g3024 [Phytophthora fragariae]
MNGKVISSGTTVAHFYLPTECKPVHAKPYTVARSHEEKEKAKIKQPINADVLEQIYDSEMASPAFFRANTDESLSLLLNFREVNKFLRRSPCYLP